VAVAELSSNDLLLIALLGAIVVQGIAANITNVYTAGLSFAEPSRVSGGYGRPS
jgi:purine-cytosine permease-like protein